MDDLDKKKSYLKNKLETELYVERYETFKESVFLINEALKCFNINYQYTYDKFCEDFTNGCFDFLDKNPNADMTDAKQMMLYTLPVILNMISSAKNKYGYTDENV